MPREHVAPQSEVIRVIVLEGSTCCEGGPHFVARVALLVQVVLGRGGAEEHQPDLVLLVIHQLVVQQDGQRPGRHVQVGRAPVHRRALAHPSAHVPADVQGNHHHLGPPARHAAGRRAGVGALLSAGQQAPHSAAGFRALFGSLGCGSGLFWELQGLLLGGALAAARVIDPPSYPRRGACLQHGGRLVGAAAADDESSSVGTFKKTGVVSRLFRSV